MAGYLLHLNATFVCPHQGRASANPSNTRVKAGGQAVLVLSDVTSVSGCPFFAGNKAQPCVQVKWTSAATRILINGQPPLLSTGSGLCQSIEQIPQGPPSIVMTQVRVNGK